MLYATGLDEEDMNKAQVGISSVWYGGNPCNMHLMDLNHKVKEGVEKAGLLGMQFNTIGVSDAISMVRFEGIRQQPVAQTAVTTLRYALHDALCRLSTHRCDLIGVG